MAWKHPMSKRAKGFTLVELLVVIGIIALLISILLPALTKARQAALTTLCLSNQRQCAMAFSFYAGDWKGETLISTTVASGYSYPGDQSGDWAGHHNCWPQFYVRGYTLYNEPGSTKYIKSPQVVLCPAEIRYAESLSDAVNGRLANNVAYAVYAPDYWDALARGFDFVPKTWNPGGWWDMGMTVKYPNGTVIMANIYKGGRVKQPSRTILMADAVIGYDDRFQVAEFRAAGLGFNVGAIHLIHQGRANVAFFDGHAETMGPRQLRYDTASAPDHFYAEAPGPGNWDPTKMFYAGSPNIAYPAYPAP